MWILFSFLAALFAGITSLFAKMGVNDVDTNLATAIRTSIILVLTFLICIFTNSFDEAKDIDMNQILLLVLSGIITAILWMVYFKALQLGDVNKVTPVDKTSIVLTLILSSIFLGEKITYIKIISMSLILFGTFLMVKKSNNKTNNKWLLFAILTALFTSIATIVGKVSIKGINVSFATLIRTIVVFIILWAIIFIKRPKTIEINNKSKIFIILSGITTCLSWLCYFMALQNGEASIVFSIEKLSIVVAILLSSIILKEKLNIKSIIGLIILLIGTLLLII